VSVYLPKISQKIRSSQTNNCDAILLRKFSLPRPSTQVVQDCKPALQPKIASASKTRFFEGGKRWFGGLSCEKKMLKHKNDHVTLQEVDFTCGYSCRRDSISLNPYLTTIGVVNTN